MPSKKKPLPLHVSLHRIDEERRNVDKRTKLRIAQLFSEEENILLQHETHYALKLLATGWQAQQWHCCLNTFCFCLCLLVLNLLIL
jgi:hypothetical protein